MKSDILYVEDNEDYIDFVKRALRKVDGNFTMTAIMDGKTALSSVENLAGSSRYKLILLDIHMPGINGIEILQKIRGQKDMCCIPIVMMSTSDNPRDVETSYGSGANAYIVKPIGIQPLTDTMKSLCDFWLNRNFSDIN